MSKEKLKFNNIIFDFDGTLADSFFLAREYYNLAAKDSGIKILNKDEIEMIRSRKLTLKNAWRVIKDKEIGIFNIPRLIKNLFEELLFNKKKLKLFKNAPFLLKTLYETNANLFIVTYNQKLIVENTLKKFDCLDYFKAIYSLDLLRNKTEKLKELIENFKIDKNDAVYIGDEINDIITAHSTGIQSIAVEWGFNTSKILRKNNPEFQVKNFQQLMAILIENG